MSSVGSNFESALSALRSIQSAQQNNNSLTSQGLVAANVPATPTVLSPASERSVSGAATPIITVEFGFPAGSVSQISNRLQDQLNAFYRIFYKSADQLQEITNQVTSSLANTFEAVSQGSFQAIQLRFASVETVFSDAQGNAFGSTRQFALEISAVSGTVENGRVNSENVSLFSLSGSQISLSANEAKTGLVSGLYTRSATVNEASNPVLARQPAEVDQIINNLRQTQESLLAFRDGDFRALNSLIGSLTESGSTLTFNV